MSEVEGRGAAWTEERGTSDERRRRRDGALEASGPPRLLRDRVVLISGGTAGLGAGIARAAAREGAAVAVSGRRREPGDALVAELRAAGTKALFVEADVGEDATQRRFHGAGDDWRAEAGASLPMGKLGQVGEIAEFVVFLLSDRSGVVTGSVIDWDQNVLGGMD